MECYFFFPFFVFLGSFLADYFFSWNTSVGSSHCGFTWKSEKGHKMDRAMFLFSWHLEESAWVSAIEKENNVNLWVWGQHNIIILLQVEEFFLGWHLHKVAIQSRKEGEITRKEGKSSYWLVSKLFSLNKIQRSIHFAMPLPKPWSSTKFPNWIVSREAKQTTENWNDYWSSATLTRAAQYCVLGLFTNIKHVLSTTS